MRRETRRGGAANAWMPLARRAGDTTLFLNGSSGLPVMPMEGRRAFRPRSPKTLASEGSCACWVVRCGLFVGERLRAR